MVLELDVVHTLEYDLMDIPLKEFTRRQPPARSLPFYVASLSLTMQLDRRQLLVELRWKDTTLCGATIGV